MAAVIANEFTEADTDLYLNALIEIGLVLFVITLVINALSRLLIWSVNREVKVEAATKAAATALPGAAT
jgi:phosphate transport system permease protein